MASVHCSSLYPGTRSTLSSALHTLPHTLHFTAIHTDYAAFHDTQARAPHIPPRSTLYFTHHTLLLPTQFTLLFMMPRHALHTYLCAPHFSAFRTVYAALMIPRHALHTLLHTFLLSTGLGADTNFTNLTSNARIHLLDPISKPSWFAN